MTERTPVRGPERFALQPLPPERPSTGKAFGAALALLGLLVGVPALLWWITGAPPIPTGLPDRGDLSEPLDVDALLVVMRVVVWLAWLQFAVCTVVEVVSIVRGGGLPRPVPLSGRTQALARALVGTLLVGSSFLASTGAAQAAAPDAQPRTPTAAAVAVQDGAGVEAPDETAGAEDGAAVQEQAPVRMAHVPGVPADMTDVIGHKVAIVMPPKGHYHDNLWDIAERTMGDGRRWKEVYELNKGRQQPDGGQLVLGRLIQPGWVLIMPEDAQGVPRVKALEAPAPAPAPEQTPAPAEVPDGDLGGAVEQHATLLASGGLLSAVLLGALLAERRRRRGAALTDPEAEAEVELRIGADTRRSERLDAALRALAVLCGTEQVSLPQVYAVTVGDDAVELHLAPRAPQAPAPWTVHEDGARWELAHDAPLGAEQGPAPYPALVCLGRDDAGRDLLLDLEALGGAVSLTGSQAVAREVVSAFAAQLAYAPWADDQVVHGYRLDATTATVAGDRLVPVDDVAALVSDWTADVRHRPAQDVLSGRVRRAAGTGAHHLVLGEDAGEAMSTALAGLTGEHDRGVSVVSAVPLPDARWVLEVDDAGRLRVPLLDVEVEAVRLGASGADALAALFEKARVPAAAPSTDRVPVPRPPRPGEDDHFSLAPVRVGVLGDLEVRTTGQLDPARVELATEIVVLLALQTAPVHRNVVGATVWPAGVGTEVRDATIERVRDWLGTDEDGTHLLREDDEGRLHLADAVAVDWHAFCTLALRAREVPPTEEAELLRRALQLVRGELLTGRPARRYAWLPRTRLERQGADVVVDAAHRLVELSLPSDPAGASAACRAGLRHVPTSQVLWRDLVLSESQNPEGPGPAGVVNEMRGVLREHGADVEPETLALVEELLPGAVAGRGGVGA